MTARTLTARWYAVLAVGVAAFTLYGSYLPFNYVPMPWAEATEAFTERVRATVWPTSKSDWLVNWLLGVPLGFCLLAALRVDRPNDLGTLAVGLAVLPVCTAFATAVEFGQLYFPGRACTGADIWAQGLGAACGVLGWVLFGRSVTLTGRQAVERLDGTRSLLAVYVLAALVLQTLPFDLVTSPSDLYRRARGGAVTVVPLGELAAKPGVTAVQDWKKAAAWCELLAVAVPGGVLLAGLSGRWRSANALATVALTGLTAGFALELAQLPVQSRRPSSTDVIVIGLGVLIGWGAALAVTDRGSRGYRPSAAAIFGQLWFGVLAVHAWQPFDFRPPMLGLNAARVGLLPFESQVGKAYLWGLEEMLVKGWLFLPLGMIAAWGWKRSTDRRAMTYALAVCVGAAAVLEFGQLLLPSRSASPTDLLFAAGGGWVGAFVTRRRLSLASARAFVPRSRPADPNWWMAASAPPAGPTYTTADPTPHVPTERAPL